MNTRDHVCHIIEELPDPLVGEVSDFVEFLQIKYNSVVSDTKKADSFEPFRGSLRSSPHFNEDLVKFQRTLRDEWS